MKKMKKGNNASESNIITYEVGNLPGQRYKKSDIYICKNSKLSTILHHHDCYEIEIIVSGEIFEHVNNTVVHAKPGDAFLLFPDNLHKLTGVVLDNQGNSTSDGEVVIYNMMFKTNIIDNAFLNNFWLYDTGTPIYTHFTDEEFAFVSTIIEQGINEYKFHEAFSNSILKNIINIVIAKILSGSKVEARSADSHINKAIKYINDHFDEEIDLNDVANEVGLNPSYFSAFFSRFTHSGFKRYVNNRRLDSARNDLIDSDLSVADICFKNGFSSLSTFYREFQKTFHQTPSECRKLYQKKSSNN